MKKRGEFSGLDSSFRLNVHLFETGIKNDKRVELIEKIFSNIPIVDFKRQNIDQKLIGFENLSKRPTVIILEHYTEYDFQLFVNFGCYVYDYRCIIHCLSNEMCLPISPYKTIDSNIKLPICYSSERNNAFVIAISGFDAHFKNKLIRYITLLGWKYSPFVDPIDRNCVTHVICGNCFTDEAIVASRNQMPLITEHWVTSNVVAGVFNDRSTGKIKKSATITHLNYICKLLRNVKICCINFCTYKHIDIKNKILSNGGLFYAEDNLIDWPSSVNIDIFIYLNPCQCEMCANVTHNRDSLNKRISWSQLVKNYQLPNRQAAIVKSSWLFSSIRSDCIVPIEQHLYKDNSNLLGDIAVQCNYFHLNKSVVHCLMSTEQNDSVMSLYSDFFNQDNSVDFCITNSTSCYQIHNFKNFLQTLPSIPVSNGIAMEFASERWMSECYNHQKIVPLHWFTFQLPKNYWGGSFKLDSTSTLLTNSKVYIADNFVVGYLFENVGQLKDLLVWMGAEIVFSELHADVIFDNSNEYSKSVFWLESIIYHQQLFFPCQTVLDNDNEYYPQFLYSGFLNPSLVGVLFQHQTFEIADTIPSGVARQLAVIISEYGGTLIWDFLDSTTTPKKQSTHSFDDQSRIRIQSMKSFSYLFESIMAGNTVSTFNLGQTVGKYHNLIMSEVLMKLSCPQTNLQQLKNAYVYFSTDLHTRLMTKLIQICQSYGAIVTDSVTAASHIVVSNVDNFSEKYLFGDKVANYKLIHAELLLKEQVSDVDTSTTTCPTKPLISNTRVANTSVVDNHLEESIRKSLAKSSKISDLENDIKNILGKSSNKLSRPSLTSKNDENKISLMDANLSSILVEMEQSYNLESQLKNCLDLSPTNLVDDDDGILITYDHEGHDSIDCPPFIDNPSICTNNLESTQGKMYKFLISSLSSEIKSKLSETIQLLGGVYLNTSSFDAESTHLIIGNEIVKNEKLLCCLATGKPILHYSYLEESKEAGYFVNDVLFMYERNCEYIDPIFADAFAHWHSKLNSNSYIGKGAFYNWHVVLYLESTNKQEGFERLISEAGGGKFYPIDRYVSSNRSEKVTHIFIENEQQNNVTPKVAQFLATHSNKVFKVNFLADYLIYYNDFEPENYLVNLDYSKLNFSNSPFPITNADPRRRSTRKRKSLNN